MTVLVVTLTVAVALLGLLVVGLLRSHAEILRALHDLGVNVDPQAPQADDTDARHARHAPRTAPAIARPRAGAVARDAADLAGIAPRGDAVSVAVADTDHVTLLAFLTSGCLACRGFWDAFAEPALDVPGGARLVVVTKGPGEESEATIASLSPPGVVVVMSDAAWSDYGVPVAPYFVLVDGPSGSVVGEGASTQWSQVRNLMSQALADAGLAAAKGQLREARNGAGREARVDDALRAAGIEPGDPSLYPPASSAPPAAR
jgi:hypothetical protein